MIPPHEDHLRQYPLGWPYDVKPRLPMYGQGVLGERSSPPTRAWNSGILGLWANAAKETPLAEEGFLLGTVPRTDRILATWLSQGSALLGVVRCAAFLSRGQTESDGT